MAAIQAARLISAAAVWRLRQRGRKHWISAKSFLSQKCHCVQAEDNYPDLDSLKGKKIAYVFGTNYQQVAESIEGVNAVGIQGSPACIEEVKSKRADACIIDAPARWNTWARTAAWP